MAARIPIRVHFLTLELCKQHVHGKMLKESTGQCCAITVHSTQGHGAPLRLSFLYQNSKGKTALKRKIKNMMRSYVQLSSIH